MDMGKVLLFANTDWYLYNFRLSLAAHLRENGFEVLLVSPTGAYGEKLKNRGFRWVPFDFSVRSANPFRELGVVVRLAKLYREERPVLAHHFTIKCVLYGSLAARAAGDVRVVNAVTGLGHVFTDERLKNRLLRPAVRALYRVALGGPRTRTIFQNTSDAREFVDQGLVGEDRLTIVRGSGVNCETFKPAVESEGGGLRRKVRVLFASRLLREKGICEVLEAFRKSETLRSRALLLIAGDIYPENPSSLTPAEVAAIKGEGPVELLGHQDGIRDVLNTVDIVVLPSYREGTPKILLEAAAMGKPIVATDIAGCRGVVEDGRSGYLVPVKDAVRLAHALETLVENPEMRKRFGRRGREIAVAEFDEDIVIRKTLSVYHALLGTAAP